MRTACARRAATAAFIVVALTSAACGEATTPKKVDAAQMADGGSARAASDAANAAKKPEKFKIGDTIAMGSLRLTVHRVRASAGQSFIAPREGHVYLLVEATVQNAGDKAVVLSSLMMFKLADRDGYHYQVTIGPETRGHLDGELGPGRRMRGEVAFEVPKAAKELELIFEPNVFGLGQAIVDLGI